MRDALLHTTACLETVLPYVSLLSPDMLEQCQLGIRQAREVLSATSIVSPCLGSSPAGGPVFSEKRRTAQ